jgi:electron transport complex protein RnfC
MKYSDVRQTGDYATGAAWPAQPPTLRVLELPTRLQVPLATHATVLDPAAPPPGTPVSKGQRLCPPMTAASPAALSPTSGRVVGTSEVELLNGHRVPAIDIEPDFEDLIKEGPHDAYHAAEQHEQLEALDDVGPRELAGWVDRLADHGVWAERVGSPSLLEQLLRAMRQPVDTVLCNVLDDEPTLRLNAMMAARYSALLLAGLSLLSKLTQAKRTAIALEAGAPAKWWSSLRRLARKTTVQFEPLLNDYPQSDPTMLLYSLMDRRLRPAQSPVVQKVLLLDAAAAVAVGRCAARQQAMLQVPLAVRDHVSGQTHHVVAPVGTAIRHVLRSCELPMENVTLRRGGVLHERDVTPDAVIAGGDLTLHVMPRQVAVLPDPCIRCAWCAESCPTRLQPAGLLEASQRGDVNLARRYGLDSCIECGVCTYVCPSRLPLLRGIRKLKVNGGTTD